VRVRGTVRGSSTRPSAPAAAGALGIASVATGLAWPPVALPGLGLLMLAPLVAVTDGGGPRRAFLLGCAYNVVLGLIDARWIVYALVHEYHVAALPSWAFFTVFVVAVSLPVGVALAAWAWISPRVAAPAAPLAFAAIWTLAEWLRAEPLGVPWLMVGQSLARQPIAIQTASLGGVLALSFGAAAVNGGLGVAFARRRPAPLLAPLLLAAAGIAFGVFELHAFPAGATGSGSERIGVVQASVPQSQRFQPGSAARNVARHAAATQELAGREHLDLIAWSETAVDIDIDQTPELRASLEELATRVGVPIVTGVPRSAGGRKTNSVALFAPGRGLVESYDKQRLVPYSEYDPKFGAFLAPLLGRVTEGDPYVPGRAPTVFREGPIPFSTPICFEVTYPNLVRRFRLHGARLILNLSNDAWFGRTGFPELHLDQAIFRAVENRSWVVRGANTGISAAIDPAGRVVKELPPFEEGTFVVDVTAAGPPPPYTRFGDAPVLALLGVVLLGSLAYRWGAGDGRPASLDPRLPRRARPRRRR
jgi:apolipoprotein N-acyltransferase